MKTLQTLHAIILCIFQAGGYDILSEKESAKPWIPFRASRKTQYHITLSLNDPVFKDANTCPVKALPKSNLIDL